MSQGNAMLPIHKSQTDFCVKEFFNCKKSNITNAHIGLNNFRLTVTNNPTVKNSIQAPLLVYPTKLESTENYVFIMESVANNVIYVTSCTFLTTL